MRLHRFHFSRIHLCIKYRMSNLRALKGHLSMSQRGMDLAWVTWAAKIGWRKEIPRNSSQSGPMEGQMTVRSTSKWFHSAKLPPSLCHTSHKHSEMFGTVETEAAKGKQKIVSQNPSIQSVITDWKCHSSTDFTRKITSASNGLILFAWWLNDLI